MNFRKWKWLTQPIAAFLIMGGIGCILTKKMIFDIPREVGDLNARIFIIVSYIVLSTAVVIKIFLLRREDRKFL